LRMERLQMEELLKLANSLPNPFPEELRKQWPFVNGKEVRTELSGKELFEITLNSLIPEKAPEQQQQKIYLSQKIQQKYMDPAEPKAALVKLAIEKGPQIAPRPEDLPKEYELLRLNKREEWSRQNAYYFIRTKYRGSTDHLSRHHRNDLAQ